jgi:hypothetical protein
LSFIETLALLHQHQRQFKTVEVDGGVVEYVEVEPADIEIAERLMMQVGTVGPDCQARQAQEPGADIEGPEPTEEALLEALEDEGDDEDEG